MPTLPTVPSLAELPPLQTIDLVVLGALVLFVLDGVRRGFIVSTLSLAGLLGTVFVALRTYRIAGGLVAQFVPLPAIVANVLGFFVALVLAQLVFGLIFQVVKRLRFLLGPLAFVDHALGALPGAAYGLFVAALVLTPLHLFPINADIKQALDESDVAGALARGVAERAPQLEALLGQGVHDSLVFRAPVAPEQAEQLLLPALLDLRPDPEAEARMLELLNGERVRAGLAALVWDDRIRPVARAHSEEMFRQRYFSHISPHTGNAADRLRRGGVPFRVAGENLAYAPTVEVAHAGLMNSPGHRANILSREFRRAGIGVVSSGLYGRMFTQNFTD